MHCRIHLLCALTSVVFGAQAQSGAYDALACDSAEMKPGCPADLDRDRVVDDTDSASLFSRTRIWSARRSESRGRGGEMSTSTAGWLSDHAMSHDSAREMLRDCSVPRQHCRSARKLS